jgi:hypothetical protein
MAVITYKEFKIYGSDDGIASWIKKIDGVEIMKLPKAEGNIDYQEYLAWVAEGNTAEPADEE